MPKFEIVRFDHSRICYKHFSGLPDNFHREGDRDFSIIIDDENVVEELRAAGWNVVSKPNREGDGMFNTLRVKVKYSGGDERKKWLDPTVLLQTGSTMVKLNESTIALLDNMDIEDISIDIRAYDWTNNGKSGRTAELHGMKVVQRLDRFGAEYEDYLRNNGGIAEEEPLPF